MPSRSRTVLPSGRVLVDLGEPSYYTGGMRFCLEDEKGDSIAYMRSRGSVYALDRGMNPELLIRAYRFISKYVFPNVAHMFSMDFTELNELPSDILAAISPTSRAKLLEEEKKRHDRLDKASQS